jgi:hypothetical protein
MLTRSRPTLGAQPFLIWVDMRRSSMQACFVPNEATLPKQRHGHLAPRTAAALLARHTNKSEWVPLRKSWSMPNELHGAYSSEWIVITLASPPIKSNFRVDHLQPQNCMRQNCLSSQHTPRLGSGVCKDDWVSPRPTLRYSAPRPSNLLPMPFNVPLALMLSARWGIGCSITC